MRKVWYHQIWIQNNFGFIVLILMHIPTRRNILSLSIFSVRKLLKILLVRPVMRLILRRAGQGGSSSRFFYFAKTWNGKKIQLNFFLKMPLVRGKILLFGYSPLMFIGKNKSHLQEAAFFAISNFANIEKRASGP